MNFRVLTVLIVIAGACAADVATAPTTSIALRARSFRPGELMVVTVTTPPGAADVRVEAMGRGWPAHEVRPGTWRAVAGIDLDQPPGAYEVSAHVDGSIVKRELTVTARAFPVRRLKVNPDFVNPPAAVMARIEAESKFLEEVFAHPEPAPL